eukprot:Hpha_TRINITY_DN10933_c0_g1::TRINITY_DN10933_c0_g1_i1::g.26637::m.26637/K16165/nagK; fumarylpyruvate hydrolase
MRVWLRGTAVLYNKSASMAAEAAGNLVFPPPPTTTLAVNGTQQRFPVRRVYCVGRNYWDHGIEMGGDPEREPPFFFAKPTDAAVDVSEGGTVPYPSCTSDLHHEVELVVALGPAGKIWAYGVGIDLTRRDMQSKAKEMRRPWDASKGFDQSGPVGALTPASDWTVDGKSMELRVNGEVRQRTELAKLIWSVPEVVSRLGELFKLEAGDILFTGTPAGVASLKPGDNVTGLLVSL